MSLVCVVLYRWAWLVSSYTGEPDLWANYLGLICVILYEYKGRWTNYLDLCLHDKGEPDLCPAVHVSLICVHLYRWAWFVGQLLRPGRLWKRWAWLVSFCTNSSVDGQLPGPGPDWKRWAWLNVSSCAKSVAAGRVNYNTVQYTIQYNFSAECQYIDCTRNVLWCQVH